MDLESIVLLTKRLFSGEIMLANNSTNRHEAAAHQYIMVNNNMPMLKKVQEPLKSSIVPTPPSPKRSTSHAVEVFVYCTWLSK